MHKMTNADKLFLTLLSKAIRNDIYDEFDSNTDWEQLFELAIEHDVCSLLYSQIKKSNIGLTDKRAEKWNSYAIISTIKQTRLTYDVDEAIRLLSEADIEVIAVKGIFFKFLYPNPTYRSMSDADILIHKKDFPDTIRILNKAGFINDSFNENVTSFTKKPFCNIEVHTNLIFDHEFKYAESFIQPWYNAVFDQSVSNYAKILSLEDCFIYTIVHMAKHLSYKGHSTRQLCDLVLLTEKYMNKMDWANIINRLTEMELKNLTDIIFSICSKYMNMTIPQIWLYDNPDVERIGDVLIEYLLKCGVFGYRKGKNTEVFELRQTKKHLIIKSNYLSLITYILKQFFPPYVAMKGTYRYLGRFPFMLPYAWLSRAGKYLKNKKKYNKQINEVISSSEDIDVESNLQKALGLEDLFM